MKKLRKNQKKKTVEAFACVCGTPDDCAFMCAGDYIAMNTQAAQFAQGMIGRK